jgi:hypothetical protein
VLRLTNFAPRPGSRGWHMPPSAPPFEFNPIMPGLSEPRKPACSFGRTYHNEDHGQAAQNRLDFGSRAIGKK